jgi:hypothetical protein
MSRKRSGFTSMSLVRVLTLMLILSLPVCIGMLTVRVLGAGPVTFLDLGVAPNAGDSYGHIWVVHEGPDGRIYGISSVWNGWSTSFFIYDPVLGTFEDKGGLWPIIAYGEPTSIVTGADGKVYLSSPDSLVSYDPATDALANVASIPRGYVTACSYLTVGSDGKIYGGGGSTLFSYDPARGEYANLATLGDGATQLTTGTDGMIYIGTGRQGTSGGAHLEIYDPTTRVLTDKGLLWETDDAYWISSLGVTPDGCVYGTTDGAGSDSTGGGRVFVYDPRTGVITDLGDVTGNGSRHGVRLTVGLDGKVYIGTPFMRSVDPHLLCYDPATGEQTDLGRVVSDPAAAWVYALTTARNGDLYGGTDGVGHLFQVTGLGPNTPAGSTVTVTLGGVTATFDNVTAPGDTTCTSQQGNPGGGIPEGFMLRGQFVDIVTTATYSGPITIGISYDPSTPNPQNLKLFHWYGAHWDDVTTSVDTTNHIVYGQVDSLSWFFIGGEWVWIDDGGGPRHAPAFPSIYIGAALGAGILAYLFRRRLAHS